MTVPVKVRKKLIEVALPLELRHRRLKRQIGSPLFASFAVEIVLTTLGVTS
jgi:hypothetical protein